MKSALEIALEKTDSDAEKMGHLTDEQKKKIASIRSEYKGKIAEREIMCQSELNKVAEGAGNPEIQEFISEKKRELGKEKEILNNEMDKKIASIKNIPPS